MHPGKIQNGCTPAVLQRKGIYTYLVRIQNVFFTFRSTRYTDVCFFPLLGVLFPREQTTQLNETVKHDNTRESDRHDGRYMYIPSFALPMYKTTCHAKPYPCCCCFCCCCWWCCCFCTTYCWLVLFFSFSSNPLAKATW